MKVITEITEYGWKTTLHLKGKTYSEEHINTSYGSSLKERSACFDSEDNIPEELYSSLKSLNEYDVMKSLSEVSNKQ